MYGELTNSVPIVDEFYQFFIINPVGQTSCKLEIEIYWKSKWSIGSLLLSILAKNKIKKKTEIALGDLLKFIKDDIKS